MEYPDMEQRFWKSFLAVLSLDCAQCHKRLQQEEKCQVNVAWPYADGLRTASVERNVFLLHKDCTHLYKVQHPQPLLGIEDIHRLYNTRIFDARSLLCPPIYEGLRGYFRPTYPSPRFKFGKDVWVFDRNGSLVLIEDGKKHKPQAHTHAASAQQPRTPRQIPHKPKRPGHVYIIHADGTTRVKIGRTTSTPYRFDSLKTASPFPLVLLRTIATEDAVKLERSLHRRYATYRQHREWFDLPPALLAQLLEESFA